MVEPAPSRAHRAISAVAALSLLAPLSAVWSSMAQHAPAPAVLVGLGFPAALAWVAVALSARRASTLARTDVAGLVMTVLANSRDLLRALRGHAPLKVDESILSHLAARTLAHGGNPYVPTWHDQVAHAPTLLMSGGIADRYGYPPLDVVLGAAVARLVHPAVEVTVVAELAVVASAILLFAFLPRDLRPLGLLTTYAVGPLPGLAAVGYPVVVATPLLLVAVWGWTQTGAGGRLGRRGVLQAIALGLACATQQLVWFVVPFLLVAVWRLRRGELDRRPAALVVLRYVAFAGAAFAVVNLPFAVADPRRWLGGVLDPLRQHAFFSGPGLTNLSLRIIDGSGALDFYRYAALLLLLTLLAALALYPARLGPVALVFPFALFWFSMRSQALYYEALTPLAVALVATTRVETFASARPLRVPERLRRAAPAIGGVAVLGCLVTALAWPAPLRLHVLDVTVSARTHRLQRLEVQVRNASSSAVVPHFATDHSAKPSLFWRVVSGAPRLAPGQQATYVLAPPRRQRTWLELPHRLYVVSDDPQTLSVGSVPRP